MADLQAMYPRWIPRTIWQLLQGCADEHPDRELFVFDDGTRLTYADLEDRAERLAGSLWTLGVRTGDRVAVRMYNRPETAVLMFALARIGAVKVALNVGIGPYELGYVIEKSRARWLVTDCDVAFPDGDTPEPLERVVLLRGAECASSVESLSWEGVLSCGGEAPAVIGDPHAISDVIFTSGSTGSPKGVPLASDQLLRSAFANCMNRGFEDGRRLLVPLPFFHCYGYVEGILAALFVSGTVLAPMGKFDAGKVLAFARKERANDLLLVPIQAMKCIEQLHKNPMGFPDAHAMYCAGTDCPSWVIPEAMRAFGISDIVNGYGMTEASGAAMQTVPGDSPRIINARVGRIMPAGCAGLPEYGGHLIEYKTIDPDTGEDLQSGETGELCCRGVTVMAGYLDDNEKNAECFMGDGWMRTGDLGRFDSDGYLELHGRIQDSYRINGENVSPRFLDRIIERCPAVNRAYVLGVKDDRHGAVGALVSETRKGTPQEEAEVKAFCRANLASFQVPKYYIFLKEGEWPLTQTGKVESEQMKTIVAQALAKSNRCSSSE